MLSRSLNSSRGLSKWNLTPFSLSPILGNSTSSTRERCLPIVGKEALARYSHRTVRRFCGASLGESACRQLFVGGHQSDLVCICAPGCVSSSHCGGLQATVGGQVRVVEEAVRHHRYGISVTRGVIMEILVAVQSCADGRAVRLCNDHDAWSGRCGLQTLCLWAQHHSECRQKVFCIFQVCHIFVFFILHEVWLLLSPLSQYILPGTV